MFPSRFLCLQDRVDSAAGTNNPTISRTESNEWLVPILATHPAGDQGFPSCCPPPKPADGTDPLWMCLVALAEGEMALGGSCTSHDPGSGLEAPHVSSAHSSLARRVTWPHSATPRSQQAIYTFTTAPKGKNPKAPSNHGIIRLRVQN